MTLVLDAGALIAVDRGDKALVLLLRREMLQRRAPVTSSAAVSHVWRGGPKQAVLAKVLSGIQVRSLTPEVARDLGVLLGRSGTSDVVDAHVAWLVQPGDILLTSDLDDLGHLIATRRVAATIRMV